MNRQNKKETVDFTGKKHIRLALIAALLVSLIEAAIIFILRRAQANTSLCVGFLAANAVLLIIAAIVRKIRALIVVSIFSAIFVIIAFAVTLYSKPDGPCFDPGDVAQFSPMCEMHYDYFGFGHREAIK